MTILIWGDPSAGFNFVGPFVDVDDAIAYAESTYDIKHSSWWTTTVEAPEIDE